MILNSKKRSNAQQPAQPTYNPNYNNNNSLNETDQFFNDFSQFNQTGYSTSTQRQPDGFFDMSQAQVPNSQQYSNYPNNADYYSNQQYESVNFTPQQQPAQPYQPPPQHQQQQMPPVNQFYNPAQPQFFNDPMTSMAYKVGSDFAGKQFTNLAQNADRWFSISKLKYYFAVDTTYVAKKLLLILFPFLNRDWSVKYSQDEAVPPKLDVNAPDMYIPVMAFVTYILMVGLSLGTQSKFTPEQLGIQASSALGWFLFEIFLIYISLQILSIKSTLKTFDIIAFCGYKYLGMILCLAASLFMSTSGYHIVLIYCCISITYFMVRNLKLMILANNQMDPNTAGTAQFEQSNSLGNKRRIYVLLFISLLQPLMMWWLTRHLVV